jgi:arylsulfatase
LKSFLIIAFINSLVSCQAGDQAEHDESFEKYGQVFKGKIAKSYEDSKEWWPSSPKPPEGTPNVVLFLLDDAGFGVYGCFGGLTEKANIDELAANGLRYNNFYTKALYSPFRASIMVARNHDKIGPGSHSLTAMGFPGYNAFPPESGKSVAKHLQNVLFPKEINEFQTCSKLYLETN